MPDKNYEVKIKTTYDGKGVKDAEKGIDSLHKKASEPILGPAVAPRFGGRDQTVRDTQAGILNAGRRQQEAIRQRNEQQAIEREARQRIVGRDNKSIGRDADQIAFRQQVAAERHETRRNERIALSGTGFGDLAAQNRLSNDTIRKFGLNRAGGGRFGGGGRGGFGGGGGPPRPPGGGGGALGGFLKLEDKVNLGGGNKLIGPLAVGVAAAVTVAKLMEGAGDALKLYKDSIVKGATSQDALAIAAVDAAKKLPIIGAFAEGLDKISAELDGSADKERARAKIDQQNASNEKDRVAKRSRRIAGENAINGFSDGADDARNSVLAGGDRANLENGGMITAAGAKAAALSAYRRTLRGIDSSVEGIKEQVIQKQIDPNAVGPAMKAAEQARLAAKAKYEQDLADIEKDSQTKRIEMSKEEQGIRKQGEDEIFSERQKILDAEGKMFETQGNRLAALNTTLAAQIEKIDREAAEAGKNADDRATDIALKYGSKSSLAAAASADAARIRQAAEQSAAAQIAALKAEAEKAARDIYNDVRRHTVGEETSLRSMAISEVQRRAARTGSRGDRILADQMGTTNEYQQRADSLRQILEDPQSSPQAKAGAQAALNALPGQYAESLKDASRSQFTTRDVAGAMFASTQDVGRMTGLGMAAREAALASGVTAEDKTAENTKQLVELFKQWLANTRGPTAVLK